MTTQFDIKQLLQKPIAMMTGEELTFLLNSSMEAKANEQTPVVQKRTYYGIEGIAQVFGCSVPTANRIKRSGIIDAAITQIGRKIIVDADMALALAKKAEANKETLVNGETVKRRIPWSIEALRQDYGKNFIADIPKFDGFCTVPNHLDYNREIGTFYNLYEPITHQLEAGQFPRIKSLMEHIFGEQYGLGMDYLQLLYEKPTQKLPVLLLVSTERNTGKTSFLN